MRPKPCSDAVFRRTWDRSPSVADVADALGMTQNAVRCRAYVLRNDGARLKRMGRGRRPGKGRA